MAKETKTTAVAKTAPTGKAVGATSDYMERLAQRAADVKATEKATGGKMISFRGGTLTINGLVQHENSVNCVIVDFCSENAYYVGNFDQNRPQPPVCYAFGLGEDMAPHAEAEEPQAESCKVCPWNKWGSAPGGRKGKACKNQKRLALVLESDIDLENPPIHFARIPVTSVANWLGYVNHLANTYSVPPFAVLTKLSVIPSQSNQLEVTFELVESLIPETNETDVVERMERIRETVEIDFPYQKAEEEAEQPPPRSSKVGGRAPVNTAPTAPRSRR